MTVWLLKIVSRVCYFVTSKNMELLIRKSILLYWRVWNIMFNKALEKRLEVVCRYFLDKIKTKDFLYYGILRLSKSLHQWGFGVRGSNPAACEIFLTRPDGSRDPLNLLYNGYRVSQGVKRPEHNAYHSPPSIESKCQPKTGHENLEWSRGVALPFL
jgi:hypothetical protein